MSQVRKVGGILHWLPPTSKNRGGGANTPSASRFRRHYLGVYMTLVMENWR